jgi:hypothetical protein
MADAVIRLWARLLRSLAVNASLGRATIAVRAGRGFREEAAPARTRRTGVGTVVVGGGGEGGGLFRQGSHIVVSIASCVCLFAGFGGVAGEGIKDGGQAWNPS